MQTYGLIAAGGVIGAGLRWAIGEMIVTGSFPWATLSVNVVGAALLGFVLHAALDPTWRIALATGFCGGLTTFSTFSLDVVLLMEDERGGAATVYVAASVVAALVAYVLARRATLERTIR